METATRVTSSGLRPTESQAAAIFSRTACKFSRIDTGCLEDFLDGFQHIGLVDAGLKAEEEVEYDCVRADRVLAKMEAAGSKTNIVILDACRDNPFERSWRRGTKGSGLATMNAPMGSLIAYATAPGRTALDGTEKNGVYTAALLDHIGVPNISVLEMFQRVRTSVIADTNNAQIPWESTSLTGNFYFASGGDPESQPPDRLAEERARLERERRELERLKLEIEKERIAAERRRLEAEKQKIESAGKPERAERESPKVAAIDPKDREIGRDRQYTAYANGVVYDSKTGLEWVAGPDENTDWNEARRWVKRLTVAGGGWRMPTAKELEALHERRQGSRNMTPLLKTTGFRVWSGELKDSSSALIFDFNHGFIGPREHGWFDNYRAFAVRSRR